MNDSVESHQSAYLPPEGLSPPRGLSSAMEGLAREVLIKTPNDIFNFAAEFFEKLTEIRKDAEFKGMNTEIKDLIFIKVNDFKNSRDLYQNDKNNKLRSLSPQSNLEGGNILTSRNKNDKVNFKQISNDNSLGEIRNIEKQEVSDEPEKENRLKNNLISNINDFVKDNNIEIEISDVTKSISSITEVTETNSELRGEILIQKCDEISENIDNQLTDINEYSGLLETEDNAKNENLDGNETLIYDSVNESLLTDENKEVFSTVNEAMNNESDLNMGQNKEYSIITDLSDSDKSSRIDEIVAEKNKITESIMFIENERSSEDVNKSLSDDVHAINKEVPIDYEESKTIDENKITLEDIEKELKNMEKPQLNQSSINLSQDISKKQDDTSIQNMDNEIIVSTSSIENAVDGLSVLKIDNNGALDKSNLEDLVSLDNIISPQILQVYHTSTNVDSLNEIKNDINSLNLTTDKNHQKTNVEYQESEQEIAIQSTEPILRINIQSTESPIPILAENFDDKEHNIQININPRILSDINDLTIDSGKESTNPEELPPLIDQNQVIPTDANTSDSSGQAEPEERKMFEKASIIIQRIYRGFIVRNKLKKTKRSEAMLQENNNTEKESDENKLDNMNMITDGKSMNSSDVDTDVLNTIIEDIAMLDNSSKKIIDPALYTLQEEKNTSYSTEEESSTFSSAATKIQAGVRGFLTRKYFQQNKTNNSSDTTAPSIGEDSRSLDDIGNIGEGHLSTDDTVTKMIVATSSIIIEQLEHFEKLEQISARNSVTKLDSNEISKDGDDPSSRGNQIRKRLRREDAIQLQSPFSSDETPGLKNSNKNSEDEEPIGDLAQSIITEIVSNMYTPVVQILPNRKSPIILPITYSDINPLEVQEDNEKHEDSADIDIECMIERFNNNDEDGSLITQLSMDLENESHEKNEENVEDINDKRKRELSVQSDDSDVVIASLQLKQPIAGLIDGQNVMSYLENNRKNEQVNKLMDEVTSILSPDIKNNDENIPSDQSVYNSDYAEEVNVDAVQKNDDTPSDIKARFDEQKIGYNRTSYEIATSITMDKREAASFRGLLHSGEFHDALLPTNLDRNYISPKKGQSFHYTRA